MPLRQQAVLFRAAHHSDALEVELGRRNIPFVKFGGLRFLEAAHVKDALACLRWAENPRDTLAAFRVAQLLPGMGPRLADGWCATSAARGGRAAGCDRQLRSAAGGARDDWPALRDAVRAAVRRRGRRTWRRRWAWCAAGTSRTSSASTTTRASALADLEQLEQLAAAAPSRERFLSDLTLDPPQATGAEAGPPHLDEDYLILSTIHSAKGQEWDTVFVLNAADGCIPSDLATGHPAQIEEERRLLYVAMTAREERSGADPPAALLRATAEPLRRSARLRAAHALHPRRDPGPVRSRRAGGRRGGRGAARARPGAAARRRRGPVAGGLGDAVIGRALIKLRPRGRARGHATAS